MAAIMEEPFTLTVPYRGGEKEVQAQLQLSGYTHRFVVQVDDTEMYFERDDSGDYRALLPPHVTEKEAQHIDRHLLQAIAEKIQELLA
ncbi:MAG: hypothetical protein ACO1NX_03700 [Chitinophagaceae bacterium]